MFSHVHFQNAEEKVKISRPGGYPVWTLSWNPSRYVCEAGALLMVLCWCNQLVCELVALLKLQSWPIVSETDGYCIIVSSQCNLAHQREVSISLSSNTHFHPLYTPPHTHTHSHTHTHTQRGPVRCPHSVWLGTTTELLPTQRKTGNLKSTPISVCFWMREWVVQFQHHLFDTVHTNLVPRPLLSTG